MEAAELGLYMFLACAFATLLQHPLSPVHQFVTNNFARRVFYGLAMGATVIGILFTPWGKQSGGHLNPAITLTFCRLGKVDFWDALFYGAAQFSGAACGVALAKYLLQGAPGHSSVRYAVTAPGVFGSAGAFLGELAISAALMTAILFATNSRNLARYTPYFVGALFAIFIAFETPLSGMSMNPARTVGSAFHARYWHAIWIYFVAPALGMLGAAEVYVRLRGAAPYCAKLNHANDKRCIFHHPQPATLVHEQLTRCEPTNRSEECHRNSSG